MYSAPATALFSQKIGNNPINLRFTAIYNGTSNEEMNLHVVERPNIPTGKRNKKAVKILGRDGNQYLDDGTVEDIVIPVKLGWYGDPSMWAGGYRAVKDWITYANENASALGDYRAGRLGVFEQYITRSCMPNILKFSDSMEYCYIVKNIEYEDGVRNSSEIGDCIVNFICDGHRYDSSGLEFREVTITKKALLNYSGADWKPVFVNNYIGSTTGNPTIINFSGYEKINGVFSATPKYFQCQVKADMATIIDFEKKTMLGCNSTGGVFSNALNYSGDWSFWKNAKVIVESSEYINFGYIPMYRGL